MTNEIIIVSELSDQELDELLISCKEKAPIEVVKEKRKNKDKGIDQKSYEELMKMIGVL